MAIANGPFYTTLNCGALEIEASFDEALEYAQQYGFDGVSPDVDYLESLSSSRLREVPGRLSDRGLRWGSAGVEVDLDVSLDEFCAQLAKLASLAGLLREVGVERTHMWIRSRSNVQPYMRNFCKHVERVALVDEVLASEEVRLGIEYIGPRTTWASAKYPFIHTLAETKGLLAAIGTKNAGLILDSFHWYTAGDTVQAIEALDPDEVVAVDVNDACAGMVRDDQQDLERELPGTTGVIDIKGFVGALRAIGFAGPMRIEPFSKALEGRPVHETLKRASEALRSVL